MHVFLKIPIFAKTFEETVGPWQKKDMPRDVIESFANDADFSEERQLH